MKKLLTWLKYIAFFAVGILLLWLAFKDQNFEELMDQFKSARYEWVILSIILMTVSHVLRALRWNMLIKPLGFDISLKNSFYAVLVGYLANLAIPRMGEVSRCVVLNRTNRVPLNQLIGTVVTERVFDFISLISIVALVILLQFEILSDFLSARLKPMFSENSFINEYKYFILIGIFVLILLAFLFLKLGSKHKGNPLIIKVRLILKGFYKGVQSIRKMEKGYLFYLYTIGIWILYWLATYVVFFSFESTSVLNLVNSLVIFVIGSLGFIMPVQGGIGTFHWAVKEAMKIYAIPETDALAYATILHGAQALIIIVLGGLSLLLLSIQLRSIKNKSHGSQKA